MQASKTEKLDLRLSKENKERITQAAQAMRLTVSEFVLESALSSADEALADRRFFGLDAQQWEAFITALDAPPRSTPRLKKLLDTPSIFE